MISPITTGVSDVDLAEQIERLEDQISFMERTVDHIREAAGMAEPTLTRLGLFHDYIGVFIVAFLVTLLVTPVMRRLAVANGIIDRPNDQRKVHRIPIAYLGGIAVYVGMLVAILFSYTEHSHDFLNFHDTAHQDDSWLSRGVPISILLGLTVITLIGLVDDVIGIDPRAKIAGQLFAAAALAIEDVGVQVAAGVIIPIAEYLNLDLTVVDGVRTLMLNIPLPLEVAGSTAVSINITYWVGTAIIAVFVLGGCNASNLVDGLDGLLTGVTCIAAAGLTIIALTLAMLDDGTRDASRIVLTLALLGACLGFLPHNFNPANIFLGDCGSMLLGYSTIVLILMLGDTGKTQLVLAGLIIYAIPIIDTVLAIVRRKISGRSISDADDGHIHHILKRALGVKGAVLVLYVIGIGFAALGVALTEGRARVTYVLAVVFAAVIGVVALKIARRDFIEAQAVAGEKRVFAQQSLSGRPSRQAKSEPNEQTLDDPGPSASADAGSGA